MNFFNKLYKSAKSQPLPQQLENLPKDKKMEYILEKIKSEHQTLMNEIDQQFEDKLEYQYNVCYETYTSEMEKFANCSSMVKKQAEERLNHYKKKIAFISMSASQCIFSQNKLVIQCKNTILQLSHNIMESQLNFIRNWNPQI